MRLIFAGKEFSDNKIGVGFFMNLEGNLPFGPLFMRSG